MPAVNFYLKKPEPVKNEKGAVIQWKMRKDKTGKLKPDYPDHVYSLVYLQFKFGNKKVIYSPGLKVMRGDWNGKKQRAKSDKLTGDHGQYINDTLNDLERVCLDAYRKQMIKGSPEPAAIKQAMSDYINGTVSEDQNSLKKLIDRFCKGEILISSGKKAGKARSDATLKNFRLTRSRLLEFEREKKYPLTYDNITLDFYEKLVGYLRSKKENGQRTISDSSIGNTIKDLKTIMGVAADRDYTSNMQFKKKAFAKLADETDAIYLTWDEILIVYRHDFSGNPSLDAVRDLFIFGCCVGLRYSDYSAVKPENIVKDNGDYFIKMKTQKTGEQVIIPCHPVVLEIFRKYKDRENRLPKAISNQKFNDYVKEVCKVVGLIDKGRLQSEPDLQLWECVSSHTARRSFATNLYLEGFPVIDLMKITGHKTESAFLTYIKVSKLDTARRLAAHTKKNWSESLLRVAS